ncbi:hypothetical protein MASR2M48_23870 [Spirochaetota bacterium]
MIDDSMQQTILVPYGEGEKFIAELRALGPERWLLRKLQRYSVNIYKNQFINMRDRGSVEEVSPGIFALICNIEYDAVVGLLVDEMPRDPATYMI